MLMKPHVLFWPEGEPDVTFAELKELVKNDLPMAPAKGKRRRITEAAHENAEIKTRCA